MKVLYGIFFSFSGPAAAHLATKYLAGSHPATPLPNVIEYLKYLKIAAENGVSACQMKLAQHYETGEYLPADWREAVR